MPFQFIMIQQSVSRLYEQGYSLEDKPPATSFNEMC